jgi:hypothetical protein
MWRSIGRFGRETSGAVSSDWVVITSGIMLFAIATVLSVRTHTVALGPAISVVIDQQMN